MSKQEHEHIELLVHKYQNKTISSAEFEQLKAWYLSHDDSQVEVLLAEATHLSDPTNAEEAVRRRLLSGIMYRLDGYSSEQEGAQLRIPRHKPWYRTGLAIASVFAVFLLLSGLIYIYFEGGSLSTPRNSEDLASVLPGGNKATLIFADGKTVELRQDQDGIQIGEEFLYADGSRIDLGGDYISDLPGQKLILETPKGGTYQVVLSDGTTVWLNANSKLIYPSTYAANLRQVEVQGEAYFDVKPQYSSEGNLVPFQVLTKTHTVTVLGTAFNVSSYESQDLHKTTLVSGKVRVEHAGRDYELIPGDQAVISPSSASIQQVQTAPYIAWKDGRFSFDGKSFSEIMFEIGQWYDLEIIYEGDRPTKELVGDAYRNQNLGLALRVLDVAEIDYTLDISSRTLVIKGTN